MKFFFHLPSSQRHRHLHQNPNLDNTSVAASSSTSTSRTTSGITAEELSGYVLADDGEEKEEVEGEETSPLRNESVERNADGEGEDSTSLPRSLVVRENCKDAGTAMSTRMDLPPADDCCPICFSNFVAPCRGPCAHWYCGSCILQLWNYSAALQPCKCPMCWRQITKLTPESSLYHCEDVEVKEVLGKIRKYNSLFVGGTYGLMLKMLGLQVYIKRVFCDMLNPDRPGAHLNKLRILAIFLGFLCTVTRFDFLGIGYQNAIDVFDYSAIALSFIFYLVGLYRRRRRLQHIREMAAEDDL